MNRQTRRLSAHLTAAAALLSCWLFSAAALALELGPAKLRSSLGERLLVEIPVSDAALAAPGCFSARLAGARQPLGMRKANGRLLLSTPRIISEPLIDLTVTVSCPNVARLQRSYTLFIDPAPLAAAARPTQPATTPRAADGANDARLPASAAARRAPVNPGQRYTVAVGDTVSEIAQQLAPAGSSIWPVVARIVADNPQAFVDGDADRLIAGATLSLAGYGAIGAAQRAANGPGTRTPPTPPGAGGPSPRPAASAGQSATTIQSTTTVPLDTAAASRGPSDADRLLGLLQPSGQRSNGDTTEPAASPFKAATAAPAAAATQPAITADETDEAELGWLTRFIALGAGMVLAILGWLGWQIATGLAARRRRERALSAPLASAVNDELVRNDSVRQVPTATDDQAGTDVLAVAPRAADDGYEVAYIDDDDTFSFHNPAARPAGSAGGTSPAAAIAEPPGDAFEVSTLESIGMSTIMRGLDEETQKLLEQDYESELTHTQQLRKNIAERALARGAGVAGYEDTEEMPMISDTALMTAADEIDDDTDYMDGATQAMFANTPGDTTALPTSLDLDIDDPSVSVVLRDSADLLAEALSDYDDEEDEDATWAERQA